MKPEVLAERIDALIRDHHDAFMAELLGGRAVSPERMRQLVSNGYLSFEDLSGFRVPGLENEMDYYTYVHMVSRVFDDTEASKRHELRRWGMTQWNDAIDNMYQTVIGAPVPEPEAPVTFEAPVSSDLAVEPLPIDAPEYLSRNEGRAYEAAVERAGAYIKKIEEAAVDEVRDTVAEAITQGESVREIVDKLVDRTDDWERNWERVARTEIQGAYNEGRVMSAIEAYGADAQIAKVTETGACRHCVRLHRGADGNPAVFPVKQLIDNGTNVGKPKAAWQATIWPVHPNCRCDTVVVPPGLTVGTFGQLERPE